MMIYIDRYDFTRNATFGKLRIPTEKFVTDTLEDEARARGVKIKHHTCIPAGIYELKLTYSNRFKRIMPQLFNETGMLVTDGAGVVFEGIRIHAGNTELDTSGCPLVGKRNGDVIEGGTSKPAFDALMEILERNKDNKINVIITNKQKQL